MKNPILTLFAAALSLSAIAPAASADIIVMTSPIHVIDEDVKLTPRPTLRPVVFPIPIPFPMLRNVPLHDSCLTCGPVPFPYTPISRAVILR